jgi:phage gp29-like protein
MKILNSSFSKALGIDKYVNKKILAAVVKEVGRQKSRLPYTPKSVYHTRADMKNWKTAEGMALSVEDCKTYFLQLLFDEIRKDALLTSQIENRKQQVFSADFVLKNAKGDIEEEQTLLLKKSKAYHDITDAILEIKYVGYNMVELGMGADKKVTVCLVPRTNYVPKEGLFYNDYTDAATIKYRELPDYGKWILEFDSGELGLLNKAVPHVLFKRFAQSCWSELCEIYGIPPRVMKTNTQDPVMLGRAEQMMKDMGAAAWFIIDETENFEWAKGADTNGDVYANLINLCDNQNSLLTCGAIIGQDTKNGNRSKDESAQNVLWELVKADMEMAEQYWNNTVIPAYIKIGAMPAGLTFEYLPSEDLTQLFEFTKGLLPFKQIDNDWLVDKFGVKVIGDKESAASDGAADGAVEKAVAKKLSAFFD